MLLKITNGCVAFGANTILSNIYFEINKGEKIALVGRNGCGKTTLLKLMVGEYQLTRLDVGEPSSMVVVRNTTIGYLQQVTFEDETFTLEDEVKRAYRELLDMERRIDELLEELESNPDAATIKRCSDLQERFRLLDGYSYKKEYEAAIKQFGFTAKEKAKPLTEFSGGQRTKIAFIRLLLSKPDILLLDEPTNHLDIQAIEWLEDYLRSYRNAVVIVSHDREFLNKIVSSVYEIEREKMTKYAGNYSAFAQKKRLDWDLQQKRHIEQQKEVAHLSGLVERFRYKATKASMAQSKMKQIERMDIVNAPEQADTRSFHADFEPEIQSVHLVLSANELEIGYDKSLSTVSLQIQRGEKIGILGGNGLGKSTFLKTIVGLMPALSGTCIIGEKVKIGYFDQHMAMYKSSKTVLDEYWDEFPDLTQTEVRSALGAFLFSREDVFKPVNALSGGEKVRLALCKILKRRPNFLVLDEPTNHMDIISKETLEKMLIEYTGTLLFVSHDRYFIKQIASAVLVFDEGKAEYFRFGYEEYMDRAAKRASAAETAASAVKKEKQKRTTPGKEKARWDAKVKKLEALLAECDEKTSALQTEIASDAVASDYLKLTSLHEELAQLEDLHLGYLEEWDVLQEQGVVIE
jgi:ATP-binding cassette subfamily F protein 3